MPYKNLESRRACNKESKRRARARLAHPIMRTKVYISPNQPSRRIGPNVAFRDGYFISTDRKLQAMVEADRQYGRGIFSLLIDTNLSIEGEE